MRRLLPAACGLICSTLAPLALAQTTFYNHGSAQDPYIRAAKLEADTGRYFSACSTLLQVEAMTPNGRLSPDFQRSLAQSLLSFGIPDRATQMLADPESPAFTAPQRTQLVERLADFRFDHGDVNAAEAALTGLSLRPGDRGFVRYQDLLSRVYMSEGRYSDAADILTKPDNADNQTAYERYNLAMALMLNGETNAGITLLDRAGRTRVIDADTLSLRDHANLILGYHFLFNQQGGTSIPVFERVRSEGPYSNRALLGLGWAMMAPRGDRQRLTLAPDQPVDPVEPFGGPAESLGVLLRPGVYDPFWLQWNADRLNRHLQMAKIPKEKEAQLRQALVPWILLLKRDPMDPAVQEAMLAIPYTLDSLGAHQQSVEYYQRAIDALQQTISRLTDAEDNVRTGRMVETIISRDPEDEAGWTWRLIDLPDAPETFYLQSVLADHDFQVAIKNYRDMRLMLSVLNAWSKRIDDLRAAYTSGQRTSVPVEHDIDRTRLSNINAGHEIPVQPPPLRFSESLEPAATTTPSAGPPDELAGPWEELLALNGRIDRLKPAVQRAMAIQNQLLQAIAVKDLDSQRKVALRYMAKARFALARIYDRPSGSGP